jgi:putative oxidoreductase
MNSSLAFVARILLAAIFLISGTRKLMAFGFISGMLAKKGFPVADITLALTIALEIFGGAMLIANWHAKYAAWALAAFTLVAGTIFHNFWGSPSPEFDNQFNHFLKNIAIVGGLLMVAATSGDEDKLRA